MPLFLDPSAWVKLYVEEPGTTRMTDLFARSDLRDEFFASAAVGQSHHSHRSYPRPVARLCKKVFRAGSLTNGSASHATIEKFSESLQKEGFDHNVVLIACDRTLKKLAQDRGRDVWDPMHDDPEDLRAPRFM